MDILPIETHRLLLRQFAVEDAEDVFAIFSDEQTTLDCGGYHAFDAMDEEYGRLMQKFAGQTRYSVVEKKTGRVVAVISMMDAGRAVPGWDLGIEVAPDAAGRDTHVKHWPRWCGPILNRRIPCCSLEDTMLIIRRPVRC